jgi:GNAT superfamily N-acetyltransferase
VTEIDIASMAISSPRSRRSRRAAAPPPPAPSSHGIELRAPDTPELVDAARAIFREYADGLGVDLCFQSFDQELATLPGEYAAPGGLLLLAFVDGKAAGCGAFRPLAESDYANACEMKRLYVRPAFRRFGLGRILAEALVDEARRVGYSAMLLDTLDDMEAARDMYATLGFEEIPPYYYNPIPGAHYLKADLA